MTYFEDHPEHLFALMPSGLMFRGRDLVSWDNSKIEVREDGLILAYLPQRIEVLIAANEFEKRFASMAFLAASEQIKDLRHVGSMLNDAGKQRLAALYQFKFRVDDEITNFGDDAEDYLRDRDPDLYQEVFG